MAVKNSLQKTGNNAPSQKLTISGYLGQEKIKTWINGMIGSEKEAQKIQDCAEKLQVSRTDAIITGIDLLKRELDKR